MGKLRLSVLLSAACLCFGARAQERSVSAFDYLLDAQPFIGHAVVIRRCNLTAADATSILCQTFSPAEPSHAVGFINLDPRDLGREDLARALRTCKAVATVDACWVDIRGVPTRGRDDDPVTIKHAALDWLGK